MGYILHRGGDQRFVLQSEETGMLVGLLFPALPTESRRAFEYDFGSANGPEEISNLGDFPELANMPFFTIEYPSGWQIDQAFQSPSWEPVRSLFGAAAKTVGHQGSSKEPPKLCSPLWQHTPPNLQGSWKIPAWALECNDSTLWTGNRDGLILAYNHDGEVLNQYKLPKACRSLLDSPQGLYAVCDDGQIYDLSSDKLPQAIYNACRSGISYYEYPIQVLVQAGNTFLILDVYGNLTALDADWQMQWQVEKHGGQGWFLQADEQTVYFGHCYGVTCFDRQTGKIIWQQSTPAAVLCGVLLNDRLLIGTSNGTLYSLLKAGDIKAQQTEIQVIAQCDRALYACVLSDNKLIVSDHQSRIWGFSLTGELVWQYSVNCGALLNLKVWNDRLYGVTTDGTLACFDLKAFSVTEAPPPALPEPVKPIPEPEKSIPEPEIVTTSRQKQKPRTSKKTTPKAPDTVAPNIPAEGVLVECYKQGNQLKVRVLSPGYHPDWNVQFPRDLRAEGMRYWVTALQEAKQGGFYRVVGTIQPQKEPTS